MSFPALITVLTLFSVGAMAGSVANPTALKAVVNSTEEFSGAFFQVVAESQNGNLIMSPLSAEVVLSMAAFGAGGNTAVQMRSALRFPSDDELTKQGFQSLMSLLNNVEGVELHLANKIYVSKHLQLKDQFKAISTNVFQSTSEAVDFSAKEATTKLINDWCLAQTNNRINDLVKPDDLGADTAMVLLNAVYFKGDWEVKFDKTQTLDSKFLVDGTTPKDVPTMHRSGEMNYGTLPEIKASYVELPYKNKDFSMLIILPDEAQGLQKVEQGLKTMNVKSLLQNAQKMKVQLSLPKFKVESEIDLKSVLMKLGMTDMFSAGKANFSELVNTDTYVSKVLQKAFIEVNEEGSEAAAVTAIFIGVGSIPAPPSPPVIFRVDKPFFYALIHRKQNLVLFEGHIYSLPGMAMAMKCMIPMERMEINRPFYYAIIHSSAMPNREKDLNEETSNFIHVPIFQGAVLDPNA